MSDANDKKLNKILVITEKDSSRFIQQFVRNT